MQRRGNRKGHALALVMAGLFAMGPAYADKPAWAGGDKSEKQGQKEKQKGSKKQEAGPEDRSSHGGSRDEVRAHAYFGDRQRVVVRDYYAGEFRSGHCPPGLAKKHNGCMPPGQAKKWRVGHPLPRDVIYYDLPPAVVVDLGPPPAGHRYVRVGLDILMIAIGTGMIVDAIQDLGGY